MDKIIIIRRLQDNVYKAGFVIYHRAGDRIAHCNTYNLLSSFKNIDNAIRDAYTSVSVCEENPPRAERDFERD